MRPRSPASGGMANGFKAAIEKESGIDHPCMLHERLNAAVFCPALYECHICRSRLWSTAIPFERITQLAAKGTADKRGALQLISSHTPRKVRAWKIASVYVIDKNTDAGDKHINKTAVTALASSLRTCRPILHA